MLPDLFGQDVAKSAWLRISFSKDARGLGLDILETATHRAADYARQRFVSDRPIGKNQPIQHPMAESWCELDAANLVMLH